MGTFFLCGIPMAADVIDGHTLTVPADKFDLPRLDIADAELVLFQQCLPGRCWGGLVQRDQWRIHDHEGDPQPNVAITHLDRVHGQLGVRVQKQLSVSHVVLIAMPGTGQDVTFQTTGSHRAATMQAAIAQRVPVALVVKDSNR